METIALLHCPHPLLAGAGRYLTQVEVRPGDSILEFAQRAGIELRAGEAVVWLNDRSIPEDEWDVVCPRLGDMLAIRARVAGGEGSDVTRVLLTLAMAIAAPALSGWILGPQLAAATFVGISYGTWLTAGLMVAGGLLINALVPPPRPNLGLSAGGARASPTYSLEGASNRLRPFEAMPLVMGTHRIAPDLANKPYTEFEGRDQYLYQVLHLGLADMQLSDWMIGTTPLTQYSGVEIREANWDGTIPGFSTDVDTQNGGPLTYAGGWITRTMPARTTAIGIDLQGIAFAVDDRGQLSSVSTQFRVQYKKSTDPGWTSMVSAQVKALYTNYWSAGYYLIQWDGFPTSLWVQVAYDLPIASLHTGGTGDHYLQKTWANPGGVWDGKSYWRWRPYSEIQVGGGSSEILKEPAPPIAYMTTTDISTPVLASRDTWRHTYRADNLDPTATYSARISKISVDPTDYRTTSQWECTAFRAYQTPATPVIYEHQRRVGLKIKATSQLQGTLQQVTVLAKAYTLLYSGGSWYRGISSNPAWIFLQVARGVYDSLGRRMWGAGLADARIDITTIIAWGAWCDTHSLTFNAVEDTQRSVAELLTAIARCGRATPTWASGKLGVVWDAENQAVVAMFGMGNIKAGSFSVSYATEKLAEEVLVHFTNPDKSWQRDTVRITAPGVVTPTQRAEVELWGCTNYTMAGKEAALIAAGQYYRRRTITWETDIEGLVVNRGDVVILSHDLTQWEYSGRVYAFPGGNAITLSNEIIIPASPASYITMRAPNGTMATYPLSDAAGTYTTVHATGFTPSGTPMEWLWMAGPSATPGKKVKIIAIQPTDDQHVKIVATDEEAGYYTAENDPFDYAAPEASSLLAPTITEAQTWETITPTGTFWSPKFMLDWHAINSNSVQLSVGVNTGGAVYTVGIFTEGTTHYERVCNIGDIVYVQLTPLSISGLIGTTTTKQYTITGSELTRVPASVTDLIAYYEGDILWLSWAEVIDFRGIDYEVRYGVSWRTGVVLSKQSATRYKTPGDGTYWVCARTTNNVYSVPVGIRVENTQLVANVVAQWDEKNTGWSGTRNNLVLYPYNNSLHLGGCGIWSTIPVFSAVTPSVVDYGTWLFGEGVVAGTYYIPSNHVVDIGRSQPCQVSARWSAHGMNPYRLISTIPVFSAMEDVIGDVNAEVVVQMNLAADDGVFQGWQNFVPGVYVAKTFDFRALFYSNSSSNTAALDELVFTVDVPDRIDKGNDVVVAAAGTDIVFDPPFNASPNIQVTIMNASENDDAVVTNVTATGFTARVLNGGGGVVRTIHWLAQGY